MKLFHISDLHFGMHHPHIIKAFNEDVISLKPDLVLISGDLTQRAKSYQYKELTDFLKQLPCLVLCVPGNHDIPLHNVLARLFYPFHKYNQFISSKYESKLINHSLRIFGVNSVDPLKVKNGKLKQKILAEIKDYFSCDDQRLNLLFFHHNFDYIDGLHYPLENDKEFLSYLKESPIHIVCTGHLHFSNIGLLKKNNQQSTLLLHAGSLSCTRSKDGLNSYYVIEESKGLCAVEWRVFHKNSFETDSISHIDFSKTNAELTTESFPSKSGH